MRQQSEFAILRRPQVQAESGYSRSTIYLRITEGLWPRPVRLGPRAVGWPARDVAAMNAARIAGRSDDDIRLLVVQLEAARTSNAENAVSGLHDIAEAAAPPESVR